MIIQNDESPHPEGRVACPRDPEHRDAVRSSLHTQALERHLGWARDFAAVGDIASALEELLDIRALSAESTGA
jgi:hypothetical protein